MSGPGPGFVPVEAQLRLRQQESYINAITDERNSLQQDKDALTTETATLRSRITELNSLVVQLRHNAQVQQVNRSNEEQLANFREQVEDLQYSLRQAQEQVLQLRQDNSILQQDVTMLKEGRVKIEQDRERLEAEKFALLEENNQLRIAKVTIKEPEVPQTSQQSLTQAEASNIETKMKRVEAENEALRESNSRLEQNLQLKSLHFEDQKKKMEKYHGSYRRDLDTKDIEIARLNKALQFKDDTLSFREDRASPVTCEEMQILQVTNESQEMRISELEGEIIDYVSEIFELKRKLGIKEKEPRTATGR